MVWADGERGRRRSERQEGTTYPRPTLLQGNIGPPTLAHLGAWEC